MMRTFGTPVDLFVSSRYSWTSSGSLIVIGFIGVRMRWELATARCLCQPCGCNEQKLGSENSQRDLLVDQRRVGGGFTGNCGGLRVAVLDSNGRFQRTARAYMVCCSVYRTYQGGKPYHVTPCMVQRCQETLETHSP